MPTWLLWTFSALVAWGLWAVLSKLLGNAFSAEQSQALSTLGMLPMLVPLVLSKRTDLRTASRKGMVLALLGGVVTCLGNVAYYSALAHGGKVATVVSLSALYPLVTIFLALIFLRERVTRVETVGVILAIIAAVLLSKEAPPAAQSKDP